ncbi:MAG: GGDEF domain-containing protein [Lachnospiraceae bacterium]|nr:GGDEF domain-containing protein [Lachnospiraceae bacterium]
MEVLEKEFREALFKFFPVLIIGELIVDTGFYILYIFTGFSVLDIYTYPIKRILIPLAFNILIYLISRWIIRSPRMAEKRKTYAVAFGFTGICGVMSVFHSFFTPMWCVPALAAFLISAFHDRLLQRKLLFTDIIIIFLSYAYVLTERPESRFEFTESLVIVTAITVGAYFMILQLDVFNNKVVALTKVLGEREAKYEKELCFDHLTGVASRMQLFKEGDRRVMRHSVDNPVSVAIIDIDNFKSINDTYGHEKGDVVLKRLGSILQDYMAADITIGRFGGEEFVFVLEGGSSAIHKEVIEEIRLQFMAEKYDFKEEPITFSAGLVGCGEKETFKSTLNRADQCLYMAKKQGKNRVIQNAC